MAHVAVRGALLALHVVGGASLAGQEPLGGEFQLNDLTLEQSFQALAARADGSFVAVWRAGISGGTDSDGASIQARRFDSAGEPLDVQFQVNTYTTSSQVNPDVAIDSAGGFLVVWNSLGSPGSDTASTSIQAQRFDADGEPVGAQFQVNSYTTGSQVGPAVAFGPGDGFIVAWISSGSTGGDASLDSIQARLFDGAGAPLGPDFQVNSYTTGRQSWPRLGIDGDGGFVVAWESGGTPNPGAQSYSVLARRFTSLGVPVATDFQVNTYTSGIQAEAEVAVRADGSFVVAWYSDGSFGSDSDGSSVQARLFDATGSAAAAEFQVNSYTTSYQGGPGLGLDARGGFVVAWRSRGSFGTDSHLWSVQARQYGSDGVPAGEQFQVNESTSGTQSGSGVAVDGQGRIVLGWASSPDATLVGDPNSHGFARRFRGGVFADGFESNGTGAWSSTQP